MRKLKLLMAACALMGGMSVWADTDVTNSVSTTWKKTDGTTNAGETGWAAPKVTPSGGSSVAMNENYETTTATTGVMLQQTVSGLTNGTYKVEFYANAFYTSGRGFDGDASLARVYVFANDQYKEVLTEEKESTTENGEYTINNVSVTDGTLKLGMYKNSAGTNWHTIQIKRLTLLSDPLATNKEALKDASSSSPIDATDFIKGSVITNSNATPWTFEGSGRNYDNSVWEVYNQNFKLSQTISNLPRGQYVLKVQGFYRAGGSGATSTAQNVKLFGNSTTTNVLNILSDSYDSKPGTGTWSEVSKKFVPNNRQAGGYAFYTGKKYKNNSLTVTLTGNSLELGLEKTTAVGSDWSLFNNFELQCVGVYISEIAKTFTSGATMEEDQWYSFTVPTDGDYTFSATDGIVYSVADAIAADNFASVSATTALPAGTVYLKSSTPQTLTISYVTPVVANGDHYLYDATNKMFLSRGANFGTRAVVDKYGIPFTWNNYSKTIVFKDRSDVSLYFDKDDHADCWLYTDGAASNANRFFAFESAAGEGGVYLRDNTKTVYVRHDGNVIDVPTTSSASAIVWTVKTKEEHDAIVNAYPSDNRSNVIASASLTDETDAAEFETWLAVNRAAKDKTSLVGTAKFTGSAGSWTWTRSENGRGDATYGTDWTEAFQEAVGTWSQTISSLPKGIYKVTVNAFERAVGFADCNTLGEAGWEPVTAYFKANDEQVQLKSWYSDKTGTNNPDNTTDAATAFNNDKYKNELYTYVGDAGELTITIGKPSGTTGSWVLFNNVTLTYYDTTVEEDDATSILSEATTAMNSPMKASLYQALATAKSTFEESQTVPNYNALRAAIDNTATSITSYANMYNNYLQPISNYLATTNFVDQTSSAYTAYAAYKAAYENYTNAETADVENATANGLSITRGNGTNYTSTYSQLLLPNWTIDGNAALTNGSGFYVNSWSTESQGTGDAADFANPFFEKWTGSGSIPACTFEGTVTGLTPNTAYDITAKVRVDGSSKVAGSITMEVVGGVPVDVTTGEKIGETTRYIKSYTATGVTDGSGNLVLRFNVAANSNISWLSFRDINYAVNESVTPSNNFTGLTTAIATAESKTLGFEDGEYAPYNNINGINALSTAKAFDKTRYYVPDVITNAATALSSVEWTQNDGEMNAFCGGDFTQYETVSGEDFPYGWNLYNGADNHSRIMGGTQGTDNKGLDATSSKKALLLKYNATYGECEGYTMPLKASKLYKITFKHGRWAENNPRKTNVVITDPNGDAITLAPGFQAEEDNCQEENGTWYTFTGYFVSTTAGNYKANFEKELLNGYNTQMQIAIADIELKSSTDALVFADGSEVPTYAPGTYPTVKITRMLTAGRWATAVYPFAVSGVDNIAVLDSYDKTTGALGFTTAAASTANEPFFMRSTAGTTEITLSNVAVEAVEAAPVATKSEAKLKGAYTTANITNTEKNYVLSDNKIYSVGEAGATIKPYRAYIQIEQDAVSARGLSFFVDGGETTGISQIENEELNIENSVYNLNGQRVAHPKKGLYIVNGKKVVVKK